jgi:hypothetical protein
LIAISEYSNSHAFTVESGRERFNAGDLTVPRVAGGRADEQKYSIFQVSLDIERLGELIFNNRCKIAPTIVVAWLCLILKLLNVVILQRKWQFCDHIGRSITKIM